MNEPKEWTIVSKMTWRKVVGSVTRLDDLLDFGQQLVCPNLPHSEVIFVKESKSLVFLVKSFLSNFYRHFATFCWPLATLVVG